MLATKQHLLTSSSDDQLLLPDSQSSACVPAPFRHRGRVMAAAPAEAVRFSASSDGGFLSVLCSYFSAEHATGISKPREAAQQNRATCSCLSSTVPQEATRIGLEGPSAGGCQKLPLERFRQIDDAANIGGGSAEDIFKNQ